MQMLRILQHSEALGEESVCSGHPGTSSESSGAPSFLNPSSPALHSPWGGAVQKDTQSRLASLEKLLEGGISLGDSEGWDTFKWQGRCLLHGGGHGDPLQYSCLENPMDREAWRATVHGAAPNQTQLKWLSTHACRRRLLLLWTPQPQVWGCRIV